MPWESFALKFERRKAKEGKRGVLIDFEKDGEREVVGRGEGREEVRQESHVESHLLSRQGAMAQSSISSCSDLE